MSQAIASYDDFIKKQAAGVRRNLAASSTGKIGTEGKVFTMPDKTRHPGPIQAIVLDYVPINRHYAKAFNRNNITSATCFAVGNFASGPEPASHKGMIPDPNGTEVQHTDCDTCPLNQFVDRRKVCKNLILMAIVPPDATGNHEICTIMVSPVGLGSFNKYAANCLSEHKVPPIARITQIAFDAEIPQPVLRFSDGGEHNRGEFIMAAMPAATAVLEAQLQRMFYTDYSG